MKEKPEKSKERIIKEDGRYPIAAVDFVTDGLAFTVEIVVQLGDLGPETSVADLDNVDFEVSEEEIEHRQPRHVSGQQLCEGMRILAQKRWGFMARRVLEGWNVTRTRDFGEIVYLLVNSGWMQKQPSDCLEDFDEVYDFVEVFDRQYKISM